MDLRQILDGGASPPAPPGKGTESPPPPDEFKKTLEKAKKDDKNPGEVAETEPNAPLQKLDSKEKKAGKLIPVAVVNEPPIAIPVPALATHQAAAVAVAVTNTVVQASATAHHNTELQNDSEGVASTNVATPVAQVQSSQLPMANTGAPATKESGKNPLSTLVASLTGSSKTLASFVVPAAKATVPQVPTVTNTDTKDPAPANQPSVPTQPGSPTQTVIPTQVAKDLNVVSVQSTSNAAVVQQTSAAKVTGQPTEEKTSVHNHNDSKMAPIAISGAPNEEQTAKSDSSMMQSGTSQQDSGDDAKKYPKTDVGTIDIQAMPTNQKVETAPVTAPSHTISTADRQKVVDTVAAKIDELSVKSVRNEVRVEMQPPQLGSVVVNVRRGIEGLSATLTASNEPLRQALHESRNDLATALVDRNVGQVRVEVRGASADMMNLGQQYTQSQSQQSQQQQQQAKQAANMASMARNSTESTSPEDKPTASRRASTTLLDMEI